MTQPARGSVQDVPRSNFTRLVTFTRALKIRCVFVTKKRLSVNASARACHTALKGIPDASNKPVDEPIDEQALVECAKVSRASLRAACWRKRLGVEPSLPALAASGRF